MGHELRMRLIDCDLTAYEMTIVDTLLEHLQNGAAELDVESAVPYVRDVHKVFQTIMGKLGYEQNSEFVTVLQVLARFDGRTIPAAGTGPTRIASRE